MVRLFALEAETGEHLPDTRPEFAQLDKAQPDGKVDPRPAQQIQQDVVPKKSLISLTIFAACSI